jgi:hypothetical protein
VPNRILKESICTSSTIEKLTAEEEIFFYRLIVNCDDYGRFDARPTILRAKCFPLKIDKVTDSDISNWLNKLNQLDLITLYEVGGMEYLQMKTWEKHQQIRAKRSKYPSIDEDGVKIITFDINGNHMKSNVPVIQSNPIRIQSESNPNPNPNPIGGNEEEENEEKEDLKEKEEINSSLQIKNLRLRYSETQLKVIDEYFDILRWTRKHGRIADSVIIKIYEKWEEFKPDRVVYGLGVYINNPKYHDKKEQYCYAIIRNAKDEEVYKGGKSNGGNEQNNQGLGEYEGIGIDLNDLP